MKKSILTCVAALMGFVLQAQVEITTKSFELASQNKHKNWSIIDAGRDSITNEIYIKFAQSICDVNKNMWTGTRTYKGLKWNIDKLVFSNSYDYTRTDSKKYESSEEALLNNEFVFGKTFMPTFVNIGKSVWQGGANLPRPLNNSFMFTDVVTGSAGISGFKVNISSVGCQPLANDTKTQGSLCGEVPIIENISSVDAKEEKGQKWYPLYNNPVPNGGNILFSTVGVNPDPNKAHYVFRKYNENGTVLKELTFSYNYQCLPTVKEIEKAPGVFDYIIVMKPFFYKKSKQPTTNPLNFEYIRVDGEAFDVKERLNIEAVYGNWAIEQVKEVGGAVYIVGNSSTEKTSFATFDAFKIKEFPALQIAKISNGKVDYVRALNNVDLIGKIQVVQGVKGKVEPWLYFMDVQIHAQNGNLFISGQTVKSINSKAEQDRSAIVTIILSSTGELITYLAKPEDGYSRFNLHFSKDGKSFYWSFFDFAEYNKMLNENGAMLAKHKLGLMSGLGICKYDLMSNGLTPFKSFINDEWVLGFSNPILFENEDEIVFQAKKLTKKAKEGEIVFVTLKK
ncbi:MAG: hypothetical protein ACK5UI_05240 [Bacteroidota bacterium]